MHGSRSRGTSKTISSIVFTWTSIGLRCKGLSRQRTARHSQRTTLADLRWLLRHAWFLCIGCRWPSPTRGISNLTQLVTQHNSSHFRARLPSCAGANLATGERLRRNPLKGVEFLALPHPSIRCAAAAATSCNVDGAEGARSSGFMARLLVGAAAPVSHSCPRSQSC